MFLISSSQLHNWPIAENINLTSLFSGNNDASTHLPRKHYYSKNCVFHRIVYVFNILLGFLLIFYAIYPYVSNNNPSVEKIRMHCGEILHQTGLK